MKFAYTILYVQDVAQSTAFYQQAFGLETHFMHESGQYAELATGETTLAFASTELATSNLPDGFQKNRLDRPPAGIEIGLVTDDVEPAVAAALAAGAVEVVPPKLKPWGQTVAYIRDPDGILIELCSPVQSNNQ